MPRFLLLTGIIVLLIADHGAAAAGSNADAARALEPAASWCVIRHDSHDQPACYENLISCLMAALAHASSCTQQRTSPFRLAKARRTNAHSESSGCRGTARMLHRASTNLTAEEREELFRKFQQWRLTPE